MIWTKERYNKHLSEIDAMRDFLRNLLYDVLAIRLVTGCETHLKYGGTPIDISVMNDEVVVVTWKHYGNEYMWDFPTTVFSDPDTYLAVLKENYLAFMGNKRASKEAELRKLYREVRGCDPPDGFFKCDACGHYRSIQESCKVLDTPCVYASRGCNGKYKYEDR